MTARDTLRAFPTWVGVLGAVVFAALMTIVAVQLYVRDIVWTAGPIVVAGLAPLLVWLRVAGIRHRSRRRWEHLSEQLGTLERLIATERQQPAGQRASRATNRSLVEAGDLVRTSQYLMNLRRGDAVTVVGHLGAVSTRWHADAPVTACLVSTVLAAQKLTLSWSEVEDFNASRTGTS